MPTFTVERTYWLPVYHHITAEAETADAAMREALESDSWDSAKEDYDSSCGTHVTGCWLGEHSYSGGCLDIPHDMQAQPSDVPASALAPKYQAVIAAAPALLDALRNFTESGDGRAISYVEALEVARAAIASALPPA